MPYDAPSSPSLCPYVQVESVMRMIEGTAKNMGLTLVD